MEKALTELLKGDLNAPINTLEEKSKLIPSYLLTKGLVKQHLDSYNYFIETDLKLIMEANNSILSENNPDFYLRYLDIEVKPAQRREIATQQSSEISPQECRLRDLTYMAPIVAKIRYKRGNQHVEGNVEIGNIPVMLRSKICILNDKTEEQQMHCGECPLDTGGYFVVKGTEKVILMQEQLQKNRIIVGQDVKGCTEASVTSSTLERKSKSYVLCKKDKLYLKHNAFLDDIPLVIAMKAMGVVTDKEICDLIGAHKSYSFMDKFDQSVEESMSHSVYTQKEALAYIGKRLKPSKFQFFTTTYVTTRTPVEEAYDVLANNVLGHIPVVDLNFRMKTIYLATMANRVLHATDDKKAMDDRDYVGNKRIELAGQLLALLFEDLFKTLNTNLQLHVDKKLKSDNKTFDVMKIFPFYADTITSGFIRAISTGNWNIKRFRVERAGVTHVLSRLSYISALGMMTRISSQFEKTRKIAGPRALQPSQWGVICPSDTPEGEACGLVKNLALLAHITTDTPELPIINLLLTLGVEDVNLLSGVEIYKHNHYLVFVNGRIVGLTRLPELIVSKFRRIRRATIINPFVAIYVSAKTKSIHVATDGGRICRPLVIVDQGRILMTKSHLTKLNNEEYKFEDFLRLGLVEYLDVNEENDALIAVYEKDIQNGTTHLEIDPYTILGPVAGLIPFPHHNQSPRNTYQCAMGKQAMGTIGYNQFKRIDTLLYLLVYPQKPLVKTKTLDLIHFDKLPAGQNAIVAVMSFSGYDIEDALVLNKASVDRGYGRCMVMRKHATTLKKYPNETHDRILDPPIRGSDRFGDLDVDGIAHVGSILNPGEIYLNKQSPVTTENNPLVTSCDTGYKDVPLKYRAPMPGVVDQVVLTDTDNDQILIKLSIRQTRRPELGDKFSSRHGQKGIVGLILPQQDMPFSECGVSPDVVMNPHGFPSRMTVGKMLELITGKAGLLHRAQTRYGTAFMSPSNLDSTVEMLNDAGFDFSGKELLYSGVSGMSHQAYIFTGPVYYQKLKHMVMDKMHARSTGPINSLTRQPTEGRAKDGGLRLGEMERDCLIGYGASRLILERLLVSADAYQLTVCATCGYIVTAKQGCCYCKEDTALVQIEVPYAAKLLFQELMAMNIVPRLGLVNE